MGSYTELIFGAELKRETPKQVIDTLQEMIDGLDISCPPDHLFFTTPDLRVQSLFRCSSYYFGVNKPNISFRFDDIRHAWVVSTRANLKNYEHEIELFLDWIKPYIESGSGCDDMYAIVTTEYGQP
ncbi:MAG: hypothetical protein KAJ19_03265, partial [Gammaproteobacteria bacterium]|nr:hypothetical protein [Gammaproteobacteria bacterium]